MSSPDNERSSNFRRGHRRTLSTAQAWPKGQPVTDLLLNLPTHNMSAMHMAQTRDTSFDLPYNYENDTTTTKTMDKIPKDDGDENDHRSNELDSKHKTVICLNCTQNWRGPDGLAINEMCQILCNEDCRQKLTLHGQQQQQQQETKTKTNEVVDDVATTLAKVSAITSTVQMKQRLAARKLEMQLEQLEKGNKTNIGDADNDVINQFILHGDNKPTRDLLMYFLRMGSFNSAPKINNVDSQDDNLDIPKGMSPQALLEYMKRLRGDRQLPLLNRQFEWSETGGTKSEPLLFAANDLTDGMRCLNIDALTRGCSAPPTSPNLIRLFQWNMLSQTLGQSNDNFVCCPDEALTWEYRKYLVVEEILQHLPDIICLQEVDHFKFLQSILSTLNYEGVFFPKPDSPCLYIEDNNGPDGCALFYKRDRFELKRCETRILEVWRVQSNQVAIAVNLLVKGINREICVATTHLKARHGTLLAKLRNEQGRDLLQFVKQCAGPERPMILCGDFNAEPIEPVYTTILAADDVQLGSAYADYRRQQETLATQHEDATKKQKLTETNGDVQDVNDVTDAIESSIRYEPPYTTWKIREDGEVCHTIDYVFYTKNKLKVKNCLDFPNGSEVGKLRTPSYQYPSDHFSLVCDFEIPSNNNAHN